MFGGNKKKRFSAQPVVVYTCITQGKYSTADKINMGIKMNSATRNIIKPSFKYLHDFP